MTLPPEGPPKEYTQRLRVRRRINQMLSLNAALLLASASMAIQSDRSVVTQLAACVQTTNGRGLAVGHSTLEHSFSLSLPLRPFTGRCTYRCVNTVALLERNVALPGKVKYASMGASSE